MDLVQNLLIKIKKMSMDLVNDRGSMDPVQRGGPWTPGPCFVLTLGKIMIQFLRLFILIYLEREIQHPQGL